MNAAYNPEPWHDFAIMIGGATAALAGLLVVAMSINVREILGGKGLPDRAAGALIAMATPLIVAVVLLIPDQSAAALGWELLAICVVVGVTLPRLNRPDRLPPERPLGHWLVGTAVPIGVLLLALLVAGIGLLATRGGGLYWLPISVVAAILFGLLQAWVLLIEILR